MKNVNLSKRKILLKLRSLLKETTLQPKINFFLRPLQIPNTILLYQHENIRKFENISLKIRFTTALLKSLSILFSRQKWLLLASKTMEKLKESLFYCLKNEKYTLKLESHMTWHLFSVRVGETLAVEMVVFNYLRFYKFTYFYILYLIHYVC